MVTGWLSGFKRTVLNFIQLQLVLTLVSLPILIAWGLPFSPLSFIGNFVFAPFLSLFLLISSFVFFCEVLHIPNGSLIYLLEHLTDFWCSCLHTAPSTTLIGYTKQPLWLLSLLPLLGFLLLSNRHSSTPSRRILCCSILLFIFCSFIKLGGSSNASVHLLDCKKNKLVLITDKKSITLIDKGALGQHSSACSYVEYTLMPTITKKTGAVHLDTLILLNPSKRLFDAIGHLCTLVSIGTIYLVIWKGSGNRNFWHSFWTLKENAQRSHTVIKRIGSKEMLITLESVKLHIQPTQEQIKKQSLLLPNYHVSAEIDNEVISIYPSKGLP